MRLQSKRDVGLKCKMTCKIKKKNGNVTQCVSLHFSILQGSVCQIYVKKRRPHDLPPPPPLRWDEWEREVHLSQDLLLHRPAPILSSPVYPLCQSLPSCPFTCTHPDSSFVSPDALRKPIKIKMMMMKMILCCTVHLMEHSIRMCSNLICCSYTKHIILYI